MAPDPGQIHPEDDQRLGHVSAGRGGHRGELEMRVAGLELGLDGLGVPTAVRQHGGALPEGVREQTHTRQVGVPGDMAGGPPVVDRGGATVRPGGVGLVLSGRNTASSALPSPS
ncbi:MULTISPECIES: hypothetical protein [Streptomyces]|uniref:hypothetical protein n=1 Tax=Streptomyces lycopersici TaxID=2974589 RepID=UPI0021CE3935|nr:hypothetical protein [Streptomyces sp. NEAU-383]